MMGRHRAPEWMGGKTHPEAAALSRLRSHLPVMAFSVVDVASFADMFKHFVFTHSDIWALFLGEKIITVDVASPPPTQQRSFPVTLVFRAILVEVENADTRFSFLILGKEKLAHWHSRVWKLFLEGDEIQQ